MAELSPMMAQYFEIKKNHPNEIVFFRLGDFYEMFYEDAILASRELELTLTGRDCGQEERAPMCGVPFHSYEGYVARLIAKGYKVAICEQLEDPALAKGIVKRDIIRVITPGTVIESSMLQDDKNNYLASIYVKETNAGICFADVSTGEVYTTHVSMERGGTAVVEELCRYNPSEILLNTGLLDYKDVMNYIKQKMSCSVELLTEDDYAAGEVEQVLTSQFGEDWYKNKKNERSSIALAALLEYLHRTQKKGVERLKTVHDYSENQFMQLSPLTRTNLELTQTIRGKEKKGTLLWVLDHTKTAMGKRMLRTWIEQPLVNSGLINERLDCVECLYSDTIVRQDLMDQLSNIFDMERLMTRVLYGSALPREVNALASACEYIPKVKKIAQSFDCSGLRKLSADIDPLQDVMLSIRKALAENPPANLKDGGFIATGYNSEVDELRRMVHGSKEYLAELEAKLREETGITKLKIGYNRVFGYYIEVSRSFSESIPAHFVRKQTLANAERYITDDLKQLEGKILGSNERLIVLEHELYSQLLQMLSGHLMRIQRTAAAIAKMDVFASLAQTACDNNYCRPQVDESDVLEIKEGRHPVVEMVLQGSLFVPNDTKLDGDENRVAMITGPNMAGKSTYMRQNALIALMAQMGSFVPAKECRVGVVDAIFTRVGASDDLAAGQSTFMVEMSEVAEILQKATPQSLVVLDEIGRGTSTFDGMSIARAVVEYICSTANGISCKTLFATHYHELTEMENTVSGVKNYNIAVKKRGDDITFLRRIVSGPADDSYGIEVAKLAGLPSEVIRRSKQILQGLEAVSPTPRKIEQLSFESSQNYQNPDAPSEVIEKLKTLDVDTLTPLEALTFLYDIKKSFNS